MSARMVYFVGGCATMIGLLIANQWHRAPGGIVGAPAQPQHLHTQVVSLLIFAHLVALSVWGGMMLNQYFEKRGRE